MAKTRVKAYIRKLRNKRTRVRSHLRYIKQKQPKLTTQIPKGKYIVQEKLDGVRTQLLDEGNKIRFINRRRVDKTKQYPEFQPIAKLLPGINIIDGEVVAFDKEGKDNFKLLAERDHLKYKEDIDKKAKQNPLTFVAFDIMNYKGKDIRNKPWQERNRLLKSLPQSTKFKVAKSYPKEKAKNLLKDKSVEGVVFKNIYSKYDDKKDDNWLKIKQSNSADLVITGYKEGEGKRKGMIGALFVGVWDGKKIKNMGKVGTGFDDKEGRSLKKKLDKLKIGKEKDMIIVKPEMFAKVSYLKKGSQGNLREPVFKNLRTDISIKETHTSSKPTKITSDEIYKLANKLEKYLKPYSKRIVIVGSIRRKKSAKDIDIVLIPKDKEKIKELINQRGRINASGSQQIFANINGIKTDIFFAEANDFGAQLLTRTGPAGGNIGTRILAKNKGMLLNQYGLFKNEKRIAGKTEREIYKALGKPYKIPELRGI